MKKNLLSVLILALLVVNLILTGIMMFSVMSTNKKTAAVVTDVASILKLEIGTGEGGEGGEDGEKPHPSMADTAVVQLPSDGDMQITLAKGSDGKDHIALVNVSLSLDMTDPAYESYGATLTERESLIVGVINEVIGDYTADEVTARGDEIKAKRLDKLKEMFESPFIYDITFSKLIVS